MSIDSQLIVSSIVGNSTTFDNAVPKLLIYPSVLQENGSEFRVDSLDSVVTNSAEFSNRPFMYVHGEPTIDQAASLSHLNAGDYATTFAGDVVVKGTIWTNTLRKSDGSLVSFDNISYLAPDVPLFTAPNVIPTSAGQADGILANEILQNATNISTNSASIALLASDADLNSLESRVTNSESDISSLQNELDQTQIASGLDVDGSYTANGSSNYLTLATSLFDADNKLDLAIKSNFDSITNNTNSILPNTNNISSEISNRENADNVLQNNIDAEELARTNADTDLQNSIDAEELARTNADTVLQNQINSSNSDILDLQQADITLQNNIDAEELARTNSDTNLQNQIDDNQNDINALQTSHITLQNNIDAEELARTSADTVLQNSIDAEELARTNSDTNLQNQINSNNNDIASVLNLINTHESSIGLNANGLYIANNLSNYISSATSVYDSINLLDSQIKNSHDETEINTLSISNLQSELNSTQTGAGLDNNGQYTASNTSNYLAGATSLKNADFLLDSRIKANSDAISNLTGGDAVLQLANLKTSVGTDQNGDIAAFNNTNYLDGITVVKTALAALDTAISEKVSNIFDLEGIDDSAKAPGKVLQYIAEDNSDPNNVIPEKFVYVDAAAGEQGPQGEAGIDGSDFEFKGSIDTKANLLNVVDPVKGWSYIVEVDESDNDLPNVIYVYNDDNWIAGGSLKGDQGLQGPQGLQGIQGDVGPAGPQGIQGDEGPAGPQGIQGDEGPAGPQGIQGPQGEQGETGTGIQSTVNNNDGTFTINYSDNSSFTTADLTGPQGDVGPAGPQGIQGVQGIQGPQGDQGIQGPAGENAPSITQIEVNNETITTTLSDNSTLNNDFNVNINSLTDVDTSTNQPQQGQVLKWDGNNWVPSNDLNDGAGGQAFTADTSTLWALDDDGNLYPHGIIDGTLDTGMFAIELSAGTGNLLSDNTTLEDLANAIQNMNAYVISSRASIDISDAYWEFDAQGNVTPKEPV